MNLTRTVAIGISGGVLVTWISWAAAPSRRPEPAAPPVAPAVERSGAELAREIERLRQRLAPDAAPALSRDVFVFPARTTRERPPSASAPAAPVQERPPSASVPRAPALTLEGMAEDGGPDGPVRTAIISASGQLFLVKVGDVVAGRYRVERLSAESAELVDLQTGVGQGLALR